MTLKAIARNVDDAVNDDHSGQGSGARPVLGAIILRSATRLLAAFVLSFCGIGFAGVDLSRAQSPRPSAPAAPAAQLNANELNLSTQLPKGPPARNDAFSAPEAGPCPFAGSPLMFRLQGINIEGASRLGPHDKAEAAGGLIGRDVSVYSICEIRDRLSRALFRRGVLARVEVPEQTIADGQLKLTVIEARIVSVRVHGDVGPVQAKIEAYLDHLRDQTPFDLDTAQRYLLLANDLPGVHATAVLRPSTHVAKDAEQGAIDLDVTVRRDNSDFVMAAQNSGSKALGPWSVLGRFDLNSASKFGERTSLIVYSTPEFHEQRVVQAIEQFHLGAEGLFGQVSVAYGDSHPGDTLQALELHGTSLVGTAELDFPLVRQQRKSVTLGAGFDMVDQRTAFPGGSTLTYDSLRVLWVKANLAALRQINRDLLLTGTATFSFRKGISALGASRDGAMDLSRSDGQPDAWNARMDAEGHAIFSHALDMSIHLQTQEADRPLMSYEELNVGELSIGRGYDPSALSGDVGVSAELKVQYDGINLLRRAAISPYAFYDIAALGTKEIGSKLAEIHSLGAGFRARLPFGITTNFYYAYPQDKLSPTSPSKPPPRVLFQIVFAH